MSRFLTLRLPALLIIALSTALLAGCDSDSGSSDIDLDDPATLVGRYQLITVVDKQGDLSGTEDVLFEAGEPQTFTEVDDGITRELTITVDGVLELTRVNS